MHTVVTKKVDGIEIIVGIDRLIVDPEETKKKINPILAESEEIKTLALLRENIAIKTSQLKRVASGAAKMPVSDLVALQDEIKDLTASTKTAHDLAEKKRRELIHDNKVYFAPSENEKIVSEDEAEEIKQKINSLGKRHYLTADKKVVHDLRGHKYHVKIDGNWKIYKIDRLGEETPAGAKASGDLTDKDREEISEQAEIERISKLAATEKAKEKDLMLANAKRNAAIKKIEMDFDGDDQSFEKAKAWLEEETEKLNKKYE
jgi:hypothetical protein